MTCESNIDVVSDTMAVIHEEKQLEAPVIDAYSGFGSCLMLEEMKL